MKQTRTVCGGLATWVVLLLTACGGGGGGGGSSSEGGVTAKAFSVVTAMAGPAPVDQCPNGGISVDAGIDTNGNGVLDASEVTSTQYVCNGANGTNGVNGSNGISTLVTMSDEPAGTNCTGGGKLVSAGLDADGNGVLAPSEVSSTAYICNGDSGTNGTNGSNGANSLLAIVPEAAGVYCTYGGNKVSSGLDSNSNGVLDAAEISASYYVCDGAPGLGITWQDVTDSSVQAEANVGYLADNDDAAVQITLPATPVIGDIVQISGLGTGGWNILQNAGQSIVTRNLPGGIGAEWTPRESTRNWQAVASSSDGHKLVAAVLNGQLYTSTDSGATWTPRDSARSWYSVASSADGSKQVAAENGGYLYTSTDAGMTWTPRDSVRNWYSVASSADGTKLLAADSGGQLYTSTNSGVTWTPRDSARFWAAVASSADGSNLVAAEGNGQLYTSVDSGVTWAVHNVTGSWYSVASSADGSKLVAAASNYGQLYTSTDFGVTWTPRDSMRMWAAVASSADGTKLVAAETGGQLYISTDSGVTWLPRDSARDWDSVASSADGNRLVAAENGGQLYTSIATTTVGTAGGISGGQYDTLDLQYIGGNTFIVRSYAGSLVVR